MKPIRQLFYYTLFLISLAAIACQSTDRSNRDEPNTLGAIQGGALDEQQTSVPEATPIDPTKYYFNYDVKSIAAEFKLSKELTEISGLSLSADGQYLLAVNDELGTIFYLDKNDGTIVLEKKFGEKGDYEGLEMVGGKIYVLRSDGTIFEVSNLEADEPETTTYPTSLDKGHNVEGLAYDQANRRLLLACKKNTVEGEASKDIKAIYAFDLDSMKLNQTPIFLINRKEVIYGKEALLAPWWADALNKSFGPSGLAVDPDSGNMYLLSSPGKLLLILNPSGEVIYLQKLDKDLFNQPEGICFGKDGTLFISSEGNAKKRIKGNILRFNPQ